MQASFFKKAFNTGLIFLCSVPALFGQEYSNKESSSLSFTVGLTSSNLLNYSHRYKSGILFNGGLAYSLTLNDKLNAGIELLYTGKAFKNDSPIIKYRYFFVDVPLYLQIKLGGNIKLNAGLQYSIAENGQMVTLDASNSNGVHIQKLSPIKSTDYGVLAGIEANLSEQLSLGLRYTMSASTFLEKHGTNFSVFQLSFKYTPIKTYKVFFHKKKEKN